MNSFQIEKIFRRAEREGERARTIYGSDRINYNQRPKRSTTSTGVQKTQTLQTNMKMKKKVKKNRKAKEQRRDVKGEEEEKNKEGEKGPEIAQEMEEKDKRKMELELDLRLQTNHSLL